MGCGVVLGVRVGRRHLRFLQSYLQATVAAREWLPSVNLENVLVDARKSALGNVDSVTVSGAICEVSGWAIDSSGRPLWPMAVRLADQFVHQITQLRQPRPDVLQVYPDASPDCGFHLVFSLLDLQGGAPNSADAALILDAQGASCELTIWNWPVDCVKASLRALPNIPDEPHMPAAGVARLAELMRNAQGYLEYGTGGSTMLATRLAVPHVVGIESDRNWLEAVRRKVGPPGEGRTLELLHVDIGPTGDWGFPVSDVGWRRYAQYPTAPWLTEGARSKVDLILIDGRFRVACFLTSLLYSRPGTRILFDDYFDRPYYADVEALVQPTARHDRIAEFDVPAEFDRDKCTLVLMRALADVR